MNPYLLSILILFLTSSFVQAATFTVPLDGKGVNGSVFVNAVPDSTVPEFSATKFYFQKNGIAK